MSAAELLARAGDPADGPDGAGTVFPLDGVPVAVTVVDAPGGVELSSSGLAGRDLSALAGMVAALALAEPGDTSIELGGDGGGGGVRICRRLVDPSPDDLREAAVQLVRLALEVAGAAGTVGPATEPAPLDLTPPDFSDLTAALDRATVVRHRVELPAGQPAWTAMDATAAPAYQLPAGTYALLQRVGDWAELELSTGATVYTDARTIVIPLQEPNP